MHALSSFFQSISLAYSFDFFKTLETLINIDKTRHDLVASNEEVFRLISVQ